ncbi:hypothetical protein [Streptomyces sp. NPDC048612]|uniref:hypothetical protein n=1 Tax=Streptomyces sp. NPDC048612 TaxID=3365579 RepID=UPI00371DA3A8
MSNPVLLLVLLAVLVLAVAGVCCLAIVSHRRIAEQAMDRARPEDVPGMLETSGRTLADLLDSLKVWVRRVLPGAPGGLSPVDGGAAGDAGAGAEGAGE